MSLFDKVVSAVTPRETDAMRQEARTRVQAMARSGNWLWLIVGHHRQIEASFDAIRNAVEATTRVAAQQRLAVVLTAHANAEESVIYPALSHTGQKGHAELAFGEQAEAKTLLAELEWLAPMSQVYLDTVEQIRDALLHHMYEEESAWFVGLREKLSEADDVKLTRRYAEEFDRYVGAAKGPSRAPEAISPDLAPASI